jgi:hypothetical protein
MSVTLMGLCWRIEWPTMPMRLLALKLADCANDDGENVYPSVDRVERETGLSEAAIRRDLAALEESGVLEVIEERHGNRWGRSTTIRRFDTEKLRGLAWTEKRHKGSDRTEIIPSLLTLSQAGPERMNARGRNVPTWVVGPRAPGDVAPLHIVEGQDEGCSANAGDATPPPRGGAEDAPPLHHVEGTPPPRGPTPPRGSGIAKVSPHTPLQKRSIIEPSEDPPLAPQPAAGGRRRATSYLPFDWVLPEADRAWAIGHAPELAAVIEETALAFRDWFAGKRRADWPAQWRTWVRGAKQRAGSMRVGRRTADAGHGWRDPCPPARGGMVHNTDEPWTDYVARMKREGRLPAEGAHP